MVTPKILSEALSKDWDFEIVSLFSGKKLLKRLPEAPNIISHEYYLLDHLGS